LQKDWRRDHPRFSPGNIKSIAALVASLEKIAAAG
jgi:hypothetical protein